MSKIILKNFSINIHEAVLQPIAAFVYCNPRQQQASRRQAEVGNFHAPQAPACATKLRRWAGFAKIILWWNHAWNKIILGWSTDGSCSGLLFLHGTTSKIILKNFSV